MFYYGEKLQVYDSVHTTLPLALVSYIARTRVDSYKEIIHLCFFIKNFDEAWDNYETGDVLKLTLLVHRKCQDCDSCKIRYICYTR